MSRPASEPCPRAWLGLAAAAVLAAGAAGCGNRAPIADSPRLEARTMNAAGHRLYRRGDLEGAGDRFARALAAAAAVDDREEKARALHNLAAVHRDQGRFAEALEAARLAAALFRDAGRTGLAARAASMEASILLARGDVQEARAAGEKAAREAPEEAKPEVLAGLAAALLAAGDSEGARAAAAEAAAAASASGAAEARSDGLYNLALAESALGHPAEARAALLQALEIDRALERRRALAGTLRLLGDLARRAGNPAEAAGYFERAAGVEAALGPGAGKAPPAGTILGQ